MNTHTAPGVGEMMSTSTGGSVWLPLVSCICVTYGRTECLQEAVQFFLTQDYLGEKELIVVDDLAEQQLIFDHRECYSMAMITRGRTNAPLWPGAHTIEQLDEGCMAQVVFTRDLYDRAGGYGGHSYDDDTNLSDRMLVAPGVRATFTTISDTQITFLCRWGNDEYHLSAYDPPRPNHTGYDRVEASVRNGIRAGTLRTGLINLAPWFRHPYANIGDSFPRAHSADDVPATH